MRILAVSQSKIIFCAQIAVWNGWIIQWLGNYRNTDKESTKRRKRRKLSRAMISIWFNTWCFLFNEQKNYYQRIGIVYIHNSLLFTVDETTSIFRLTVQLITLLAFSRNSICADLFTSEKGLMRCFHSSLLDSSQQLGKLRPNVLVIIAWNAWNWISKRTRFTPS
jgi:hypothetical protein